MTSPAARRYARGEARLGPVEPSQETKAKMSKLVSEQRSGYLELVKDLRERYLKLTEEPRPVREERERVFERAMNAKLGLPKVEREKARVERLLDALREKQRAIEREVGARWQAEEQAGERPRAEELGLFENARAVVLGAEEAAEATAAVRELVALIKRAAK